MNIDNNPIELAVVVVSQVFDFIFPVIQIAPGARILIVRNQAAFEFRNGAGLPIAGEYGDSKLSNGGEQIVITAADGSLIRDFAYSDDAPWPTSADGSGTSLHLINPTANPAHADPANWRSGGSPGVSGTIPFTGSSAEELLQYALGDELTIPEVELVGGNLVFRFPISSTAEGIDYIVETSSDLLAWQTDANFSGEIISGGTTREYSRATLANERRFIRLRVVQP